MTMTSGVAAVLVAAAALLLPAGLAAAQEADVPTVGVAPADMPQDGPNQGRWFAEELAPGATARTSALLSNSAPVAQSVQIYARDLRFGEDGTPDVVDAPPTDVGAWVTPDVSELRLEPGQTQAVGFTLTVPTNAEPGDHIGVIVVESAPLAGDVTIVKRVATRLYVTVPGEATRDVEFAELTRKTVGGLFPRLLEVEAGLRNTGRIRLNPAVTINGLPAAGSAVLLTQSVEVYRGSVDIPWYGGPVRVDVRADAGDGLTKQRTATMFVVPWALIAILLLALLSVALLTVAWRRRGQARRDEVARLHAELQRLQDRVGGSA